MLRPMIARPSDRSGSIMINRATVLPPSAFSFSRKQEARQIAWLLREKSKIKKARSDDHAVAPNSATFSG
jgi:hypothetical protein